MWAQKMMETQTKDKGTPHETLTQEFKTIILEYITKVNSRYRANEFTSSQLAKNIMTTTETEKTRFPIVHRIVKGILRSWQEQGLCTHISRTKYSRCRKTKDTYRFKTQGMKEIKKRAIEETIRTINEGNLKESPIMKTREMIIRDKLEELASSMVTSTKKQSAGEDA